MRKMAITPVRYFVNTFLRLNRFYLAGKDEENKDSFWLAIQLWLRAGITLQCCFIVLSFWFCWDGRFSNVLGAAATSCASFICFGILWWAFGPPNSWWFLWRGPILSFDENKAHNYAQNLVWLMEQHAGEFVVLDPGGTIKFRKADLAILFKVKTS